MKRYHSVRISYLLVVFFWGSIMFLVCSVLGVLHAATASSDISKNSLPTVVLDAGHGGEDGGAIGANHCLEKDINLSISLIVRDHLEKAGVPVLMIRDTDISVGDSALSTVAERKRSDIQHRATVVNQTENCILVSIHQNYFEQSQYSGAQMFYSVNDENSLVLAECIRKNVVNMVQPENKRENKPAEGIYLLDHVDVPAVIVECGFISNPHEADLLIEPNYQQRIADAIAEGIIAFCVGE